MINIVISKLFGFEVLVTLFYFSEVRESSQWQLDYNLSYPNFTIPGLNDPRNINLTRDQKNLFKLNGQTDQRIKSALSETLKNMAISARQPMPVLTWKQNPIQEARFKFDLQSQRKPSNIKEYVQRSIKDSESASKVAAKQTELQQLLQQLYQAEATVQMEVGEVTRSQQIASETAQALEDATNKVRMLSTDLRAAQEEAATCAMQAHTAQLQLAAHDQLMFTARQRVDTLSAQMVYVQADLACVQNKFTLNESSQHLEQQGRLASIYQFQPGVNVNSPDLLPAAAPVGPVGLPLSQQEQQAKAYPMFRVGQPNLP